MRQIVPDSFDDSFDSSCLNLLWLEKEPMTTTPNVNIYDVDSLKYGEWILPQETGLEPKGEPKIIRLDTSLNIVFSILLQSVTLFLGIWGASG